MVAVLVGFMGAGKTTVGRIIAERLGQPFVDSDVLIEQRLGREIRDIFATEGEAYFRELEHATVADLVRGPEAVVALGGGAAEDKRTRAVLRNARVVYLRVSYDEAMSRIRGDKFRPLLSRPDLDKVYQRRLPIYQDVSVFTIDTDGRRPGCHRAGGARRAHPVALDPAQKLQCPRDPGRGQLLRPHRAGPGRPR